MIWKQLSSNLETEFFTCLNDAMDVTYIGKILLEHTSSNLMISEDSVLHSSGEGHLSWPPTLHPQLGSAEQSAQTTTLRRIPNEGSISKF